MRKYAHWTNLIAFIVMIAMNGLANALPIGGLTTGEVSELFDNLFVPAGRTFAIWGLIYLLLAIFVIAGLFSSAGSVRRQTVMRIAPWVSVNFLLNASWILAWHHLYVGLAWLIMTGILLSLIIIYVRLSGAGKAPLFSRWLVEIAPFTLYLGWICVAMIANGAAWLTDTGIVLPWSEESSVVLMVTVACFLSGWFLIRYKDAVPIWVLTWAVYGIRDEFAAREGVASFPLEFFQVLLPVLIAVSVFGLYLMIKGRSV